MDVLAKDYLERAKNRIIDATSALTRGAFPEVVTYSQECVELSLKAVLRVVGIEYPKVDDVGDILEASAERFPDWFKEHIPKLRRISMELAQKRGPSLYGIERIGKPPSEIFNEADAKDALEKVKFVHKLCCKFFKYFYSESSNLT